MVQHAFKVIVLIIKLKYLMKHYYSQVTLSPEGVNSTESCTVVILVG